MVAFLVVLLEAVDLHKAERGDHLYPHFYYWHYHSSEKK
jgi:hypothetical protein